MRKLISKSNYDPTVMCMVMVDGSSMISFPRVIADSERDMSEIEPGPLGWHTSALTTELQEVRRSKVCQHQT